MHYTTCCVSNVFKQGQCFIRNCIENNLETRISNLFQVHKRVFLALGALFAIFRLALG